MIIPILLKEIRQHPATSTWSGYWGWNQDHSCRSGAAAALVSTGPWHLPALSVLRAQYLRLIYLTYSRVHD